MDKKGLGVSAIILLALGVSVLLVSSSVISREGGLFNTLNSPYTVDSFVAKCRTECASLNKDAYCSGPKTLKSDKETLKDITCIYLVENKPEYNLERCDKIQCSEQVATLEDNPQEISKPQQSEELNLIPGESCQETIENLIKKYCAKGNSEIPDSVRDIEINPVLFKAILLHENPTAFNEGCPYKEVGSDKLSLGLMQVTSETACDGKGAYGLPKDTEDCEEELKTNIEASIRVASIILRIKYNEFAKPNPNGRSYPLCDSSKLPKRYYGWQAALRGYNGWVVSYNNEGECITNDHYVEDVLSICERLAGKPCLDDKGQVII